MDEAGKLGCGFDHQDSGKEGAAGNVAGDPELVVSNIPPAHALGEVIRPGGDAVDLDHVASVRIDRLDGFEIGHGMVEIGMFVWKERFGRQEVIPCRGGKVVR